MRLYLLISPSLYSTVLHGYTSKDKALGLFGQEADDPPTNSGSISDPDTVIATNCSSDMTESWQHSYYGAPVELMFLSNMYT
jgi:hypothetical protein